MMRDDGCVCRLLSPRIGSNMAEAFIILGSIIDWLTCSGHHVLPRDTVPRSRTSCAFRTIFTAFQSLVPAGLNNNRRYVRNKKMTASSVPCGLFLRVEQSAG